MDDPTRPPHGCELMARELDFTTRFHREGGSYCGQLVGLWVCLAEKSWKVVQLVLAWCWQISIREALVCFPVKCLSVDLTKWMLTAER